MRKISNPIQALSHSSLLIHQLTGWTVHGPLWIEMLACRVRGARLFDGFNRRITLVFMDPLLSKLVLQHNI